MIQPPAGPYECVYADSQCTVLHVLAHAAGEFATCLFRCSFQYTQIPHNLHPFQFQTQAGPTVQRGTPLPDHYPEGMN